MKYHLSIIMLSAAILYSCDSPFVIQGVGERQGFQLELDEISRLSVSGGTRLILQQGSPQQVVIEVQPNLLSYVNQQVRNGKWNVEFTHPVSTRRRMLVYITLENLEELTLSGGSEAEIGELDGSNSILALNASGGSKISGIVHCHELLMQLSGGSLAILNGESDFRMRMGLSGGSRCLSPDWSTPWLEADLSGGSNAILNITEELNGNLSGGSMIEYYGNPSKVSIQANGGSRAIPR
jgi:hypothetical protein